MACHSLLQWTTFYQTSPPVPVCLGSLCEAWLIVSLSYTSLLSFWLFFCDCGFILSVLQWMRIRELWELPDGRDWLWGKLDLVLMGGEGPCSVNL